MPENTDLDLKTNASVSRFYHWVKNDRTYQSGPHRYDISFRKVAALAETLKEFAADSELEREVVSCPRLESFVEFDLQKGSSETCKETDNGGGPRAHGGEKRDGTHGVVMIEALEHPHLAI